MKVPEGYDFLYSCSCDLERQQFAQSLGHELTQPLETGTDNKLYIKYINIWGWGILISLEAQT